MEQTEKKNTQKRPAKKGGWKGHLWAVLLTLLAFAVYDYVELPAYNIQSGETWFTVCGVLALFGVLELIFHSGLRLEATNEPSKMIFGSSQGLSLIHI